jgi:hypothetical protein
MKKFRRADSSAKGQDMKFGILAVILMVASCAPSQSSRPISTPGPAPAPTTTVPAEPMPGRVTNQTKPASNYSQDAIECERKAALSQAGGKGEAFAACMRLRGYSANR